MNWKEIGLICGIEIHQQIEGQKLFCSCPTLIREDESDFSVERKLRAVVGETGEIDPAAAAEMAKGKKNVYHGYSDTTCLVELDEEPPHMMNNDALFAGVQSSMLLDADLVDEVQIMRKTVVDGSNTSGFQRTALISRNGSIDTSEGIVTIPAISLEEDSCKIMERGKNSDIYNLSRLGIPLIEIGTGPDIKTPEQAKEVAAHIGMILRSTGKCKRGLGTIRQDVNVSVKGGDRIEIKGAQDLKMIPTYVEYEAKRQLSLLEIKEKVKGAEIKEEILDITSILSKSESKVIKSCLEKKGIVKAISLPSCFEGLIGSEVQPGRRLGTEFSDYAKVAAGVGGLFHSDELPKYGITQEEVDSIKKKVGGVFILVADSEERVVKALNAVVKRVKLCSTGVVKEVRRANPDGSTTYMRPMPGAARMYPETDTLPMKVDPSSIVLPELINEKIERFQSEYGISKDLARDLCRENYADLFENFAKRFVEVKTAFMAECLIGLPKTLGKKNNISISVTDEQWDSIFEALNSGELVKDSIESVVLDISKDQFDLSNYKPLSDSEIAEELSKIKKENSDKPPKALIGIAMGKLKGKASGKKIMELLNN